MTCQRVQFLTPPRNLSTPVTKVWDIDMYLAHLKCLTVTMIQTGITSRMNNHTGIWGFMIVDRSALYGSRNIVNQHRDMRLDIDNMSYENFLHLGTHLELQHWFV
ncbi:uncharacterized protein LOC133831022 isoform X2 [Humulus lupulus]|uniref:uncharacterized protein LOC133831022 isoform X2 n=1 Tax=Humulus lupulus TaxID=3486 RepID=UPI002B40B90B|nr:uncharacterized protein LOC133831022 isoform X2 [Humulus lupulus]